MHLITFFHVCCIELPTRLVPDFLRLKLGIRNSVSLGSLPNDHMLHHTGNAFIRRDNSNLMTKYKALHLWNWYLEGTSALSPRLSRLGSKGLSCLGTLPNNHTYSIHRSNVFIFVVQVDLRLKTEVLCTPSSTQPGVRTHDLQIMTVHFMSLRRLL